MEKIIHVKGHFTIRNGKRVYVSAYTYSRVVKEPKLVHGNSHSVRHNVSTIGELRKIAQFSDKECDGYREMSRQYPEVVKLLADRKVPKKRAISEKLRQAIHHFYSTLYE